jgi:hypothetical protein
MSNTPNAMINYDATHNTIIRIRERDIVNSIYCPRQLQNQSTNAWLNVADHLFSNNTQSITEQINTATNSIVGAVGALATLANYYQSLQFILAVTADVVVGSGLLLAFTLKEDRYEEKTPLYKRAPSNGECFNQLELKYSEKFQIDAENKLSINTTGFLCP